MEYFQGKILITIISFLIIFLIVLRKFIEIGFFGKNEKILKDKKEDKDKNLNLKNLPKLQIPKLDYGRFFQNLEKKSKENEIDKK